MTLEKFTIVLTPVERFFFGGEIVFGADGADTRRRSYLVKSRCLPQQTSLLGLVREQTLAAANQLRGMATYRHAQAAELVGNTGFKVTSLGLSAPRLGYGAIKDISPLSLQRIDPKADAPLTWHPLPLDDAKVEIEKNGEQKKSRLKWKRQHDRYWNLKHFNAKDGLALRFACAESKPMKLDDCFASQSITGNRITNRNYRDEEEGGEAKEEGLFRQTFRRNVTAPYATALDKKYRKEHKLPKATAFSFCFQVTLDMDVLGAHAGAEERWKAAKIVTLGGERSTFHWEVTDVPPAAFAPANRLSPKLSTKFSRIALQSDTYLPKALLEKHQAFLLGKTKSFRFFSTQLNQTKHFYDLERDPSKHEKSESRLQHGGFTLIERGGVILLPKTEAGGLKEAIEKFANFHQIGYNHCTITQ